MRRRVRYLGHIAPLLACLALLAGCLQRVAAPAPAPSGPAVATVPAAFFAARPYGRTPTTGAAGATTMRFILGRVETLPADDPRARYAAPLRQRDTGFVQVSLRIVGLDEPHTPSVAYELITEAGVFGALASGEWEAAVPNGATYEQDGVLLFVVPSDLRAGRLEIVDYAYPQGSRGGQVALQRRVVAAFDLPRLR